jgi:hypothetical protein
LAAGVEIDVAVDRMRRERAGPPAASRPCSKELEAPFVELVERLSIGIALLLIRRVDALGLIGRPTNSGWGSCDRGIGRRPGRLPKAAEWSALSRAGSLYCGA